MWQALFMKYDALVYVTLLLFCLMLVEHFNHMELQVGNETYVLFICGRFFFRIDRTLLIETIFRVHISDIAWLTQYNTPDLHNFSW